MRFDVSIKWWQAIWQWANNPEQCATESLKQIVVQHVMHSDISICVPSNWSLYLNETQMGPPLKTWFAQAPLSHAKKIRQKDNQKKRIQEIHVITIVNTSQATWLKWQHAMVPQVQGEGCSPICVHTTTFHFPHASSSSLTTYWCFLLVVHLVKFIDNQYRIVFSCVPLLMPSFKKKKKKGGWCSPAPLLVPSFNKIFSHEVSNFNSTDSTRTMCLPRKLKGF